ncbi:PASTA domain-containing protein, partial [Escherichia coli]|nr:PASTA domain-containing protein [Escherichia coli]
VSVSKGVELLDVPSTVGATRQKAGELLAAAGFRTTVQEVFSETVARGTVVAQDPPGGRLARAGRVTLQVSRGPERIAVPDLRDKTDAGAKAALAAAGLEGRGVRPPLFGGDRVSRQDPAPGTRVRRGTTVTY